MKTLLHHLVFFFLQISLLVMLCYLSHVAAVNNGSKCIDHEREALLQFKRGITSDYCGMLNSWGEQEDCCQWIGIRCSNLTGHVIMLHLRAQDFDQAGCTMEGQLGTSLFELKHLKHLDFSYITGFVGEIPPQLGNLSRLESLDISYSVMYAKSLQWLSRLTMLKKIDLSGSNLSEATDLFNTINKMPSLRVLYLDDCELPPILPSSLSYLNASTSLLEISLRSAPYNDTSIFNWLFNLSKHGNQFEYLDLSSNMFAGSIPSAFGDMHSLSYLDLSSNRFAGPIPSEFGNMHSLSYLDLSRNRFADSISRESGDMTSLPYRDLSRNGLEGSIPDSFSNLKSLRYLSLSQNNFHGLLSKSLKNLCYLQELYLDDNSFTDDLSAVIQTLSSGCANKPILKSLSLRCNQLWGSIPDIINIFSSMTELYLDGNKLNGTISQGIGQLLMLEKLDVSNNSLKATLNHTHFFNLSRLSQLKLSDNAELVFNVSADWIPPFQLVIISLRSCNLGSDFPNWILTQKNVSYLDISNSQISDSIPAAFWTKLTTKIEYLNVSHNKIHGVLPDLSITFHSLYVVDLSSNCLEGSIPSFLSPNTIAFLYLRQNKFSDATHFLCPKTEIRVTDLDLSNNLLFGELPDCWLQFPILESLHLENNKFFGSIPTSIGTLNLLLFLHLNNNSFSGELPESLENCTWLKVLDLGNNSLTGNIPSSIGNALKDLFFLNLRQNKFFGSLPSSLCQLSNLHILDLAMNHISSAIPKCIYNLTAMADTEQPDVLVRGATNSVHISEFTIEEKEETATIMWKREEQSFRSNTFMSLVKSIDLSRNQLQGHIPNGISQLRGLISLDLSRNNLSGGIPSNIGQLTLLDFLDLSNNHLSGGIPISLANVIRLGTLNLSYNNLSGKIPLSTQLQGFYPSSYMGNPLLCGAPLHECAGHELTNGENIITQNDRRNDDFYLGLYISVVLGFIIGFWGVCGTLVVKSSWRHAFFRYFDDMKDKIYVMVVVSVSKVWKKP